MVEGVFGDARVGFMGARVTEPAPSQGAFHRLLKAPQRAAEEPTRVGATPGGTEAPAASERVGWWQRIFGG